jgi:DNA uptake protein ComE-like DNA-binding protein
MAKIYSKNKQYNGISASVNFINGVGESNLPHLLDWFQENGYTIIEDLKGGIGIAPMHQRKLYGSVKPT